MDIALALDALVPGAVYFGSVTDNTRESFDGLDWQDERSKPSWQEVEVWQPVVPEPDYLTLNTVELERLQRLANAQVAALQGRVDALIDATELDMATPEEIAEQPVRADQLKAWKTYRVLLGRVATAPGWPQDPAWPEQPALFTSETQATPIA